VTWVTRKRRNFGPGVGEAKYEPSLPLVKKSHAADITEQTSQGLDKYIGSDSKIIGRV
jgi:hypothetical protein